MKHGSQTRSSSSPTFHFLAGASSGVLTAVLLQPADLLKTRVQQSHSTSLGATIRSILSSDHPIRSFWRGTLPSALRTGFGSALYFTSLHSLRQHFAARGSHGQAGTSSAGRSNLKSSNSSSVLAPLPPATNLAIGAFARAAAGFVLMPITVLKVRYESNLFAYKSLLSAASDVLSKEGPRGFFAGFGATAVRDAPYAGLYVLFYEAGKSKLSQAFSDADRALSPIRLEDKELGTSLVRGMSASMASSINFTSGVLAAATATALTNPFDAVKTRLQLMPSRYGNMVQAARMMLRQEGLASMFDGLGLRMARKAMSSALAWTVYEELVRRAEIEWRAFGSL